MISELAQASAGQGPAVAQALDEGAKLATFLDQTLPAQLSTLDALDGFTGAFAPTGPSINALSGAENRLLPSFNAAAPSYAKLLAELQPFADNLAQLLAGYRPDITTLLDSGDNVARVLLAQQQDIGQVIDGAAVYAEDFAKGASPEVLPNGTHFAYFRTFILFSDINNLVCNMLAPAQAGLSFLEPLQQALTGAGSPLNCSSQIAAFDAAQSSPASTSHANQPTAAAAGKLSTDVYQQIASPQPSQSQSLQGYVNQLLGGL